MPNTTKPEERTAVAPQTPVGEPVTLINKFVVPPERDEEFLALWTDTSMYFRAQPGYLSLCLHKAASADAEYRYVNVARWATLQDFQAAHATEEFRRVVGQPAWSAYASNPTLYQVVVEDGADALEAAGRGAGR